MNGNSYNHRQSRHAGDVPIGLLARIFEKLGDDVVERSGIGVTVSRPTGPTAEGTTRNRDRLLRRSVPRTPAPGSFCPDLLTGQTTWATLLDRATQLSAREMDVFLLLGVGASNRTIAGRLNVTERTVKAHVAQVMSKLAVESRLQAGLVSLVFRLTYEGALSIAATNGGESSSSGPNATV